MNNYIEYKKDKKLFLFNFNYNKNIINFIKDNFLGYIWDGEKKQWFIPPYKTNVEIIESEEIKQYFNNIKNYNGEIIPAYIIEEFDDDKISIKSPYDKELINLIKRKIGNHGRYWLKRTKKWIIFKKYFHLLAFDLIKYLDSIDENYLILFDIDSYLSDKQIIKLETGEFKEKSPSGRKTSISDDEQLEIKDLEIKGERTSVHVDNKKLKFKDIKILKNEN